MLLVTLYKMKIQYITTNQTLPRKRVGNDGSVELNSKFNVCNKAPIDFERLVDIAD